MDAETRDLVLALIEELVDRGRIVRGTLAHDGSVRIYSEDGMGSTLGSWRQLAVWVRSELRGGWVAPSPRVLDVMEQLAERLPWWEIPP